MWCRVTFLYTAHAWLRVAPMKPAAGWFPVTAEIHAATQEEDSGLFLFLFQRFSHHALYRQLPVGHGTS